MDSTLPRFLETFIRQDLKWENMNIISLIKKAQTLMMGNFYTSFISIWYAAATATDLSSVSASLPRSKLAASYLLYRICTPPRPNPSYLGHKLFEAIASGRALLVQFVV